MARVVYRDENYQTFYVDVNDQQPEVTIGRNQGNRILIPTKSLSRYHAKIIYQNRHYYIIDLKSSNGTYVNDVRVDQQEIHPGDQIRLGDVDIEFIDDNRAISPVPHGMPSPNPMQPTAMPSPNPMQPGGMPSLNPMQQGAMPSLNPMQSGGMPSLNPMQPGAMPSLSPMQPGGMPSLNPMQPGGMPSLSPMQPSSMPTLGPISPNTIPSLGPASQTGMPSLGPASPNGISPIAPIGSGPGGIGRPSAPSAAPGKMAPPKISLTGPNQPNMPMPELRSVSMRPISSGGTYRPTMPNQPAFDDDMAKIASQISAPVAPTNPAASSSPAGSGGSMGMIDAAAAPMSFNPNSMGIRPVGPQKTLMGTSQPSPTNEQQDLDANYEPTAMGGQPLPPPQNNVLGMLPMPSSSGTISASAAPATFNPNSMGLIPKVTFTPSGLVGGPNSPNKVTMPQGVPSGVTAPSMGQSAASNDLPDPAAPPTTFNPESMGFGVPQPHAENQPDANPADAPDAQNSEPSPNPDAAPAPENASDSDKAPEDNAETPSPDAAPDASQSDASSKEASSADSPEAQASASGLTDSPEEHPQETHSSEATSGVRRPAVSARGRAGRANMRTRGDGAHASIPATQAVPTPANSGSFNRGGRGVAQRSRVSSPYLPAVSDSQDSHVSDVNVIPGSGSLQAVDHPEANEIHENLPLDADAEDVALKPESSNPIDEIDNPIECLPEVDDDIFTDIPNANMEALFDDPIDEDLAAPEEHAHAQAHSENEAELKKLYERCEDAEQTIEMLNAAMAELKEMHASELEKIQTEHAQKTEELQSQIDNQNKEIEQLKAQLEQTEASSLKNLIPKWSARFNALIQYAKATDRAAERLNLEASEPKAIEYIRSMSDMIQFCADDLKSITDKITDKME